MEKENVSIHRRKKSECEILEQIHPHNSFQWGLTRLVSKFVIIQSN